MIQLSEAEIQMLIEDYCNKNKNKKELKYNLREILEMGINYLYAKEHLKDGKIIPCSKPFSIMHKHHCLESENKKTSTVEIIENSLLEKARDTLSYCWTGSNLAILTSDNYLHGYYKNTWLFDMKVEDSSQIVATCDSIFIGKFNGDIVHFDPITQNLIEKRRHSDIITSMYWINNKLLTSSLDGSIFHSKKIDVGNSVLDVKFMRDDMFMCSCIDFSICVVENEEVKRFMGHSNTIKSITYNKVGISTSLDGQMGILHKDKIDFIKFGCSMHKREMSHFLVGYGLNDIKFYDLNTKKEEIISRENTTSLSIYENIIAYSLENKLKIIDRRCINESPIEIYFKEKIRNLEFSDTGEQLLICTDDSPYLTELKIKAL